MLSIKKISIYFLNDFSLILVKNKFIKILLTNAIHYQFNKRAKKEIWPDIDLERFKSSLAPPKPPPEFAEKKKEVQEHVLSRI